MAETYIAFLSCQNCKHDFRQKYPCGVLLEDGETKCPNCGCIGTTSSGLAHGPLFLYRGAEASGVPSSKEVQGFENLVNMPKIVYDNGHVRIDEQKNLYWHGPTLGQEEGTWWRQWYSHPDIFIRGSGPRRCYVHWVEVKRRKHITLAYDLAAQKSQPLAGSQLIAFNESLFPEFPVLNVNTKEVRAIEYDGPHQMWPPEWLDANDFGEW